MSDQTIFGNEQAQETLEKKEEGTSNAQGAQNNEPFADLLGAIKNERGEPKYKSTDDAIKALKHSQEFIPQLQTENQQLRTKVQELEGSVERLKRVEEVVERLTASQEKGGNTNQPAFDEQTIADLMERTLSKREIEARQKANVSFVAKAMQEKFGAEAEKLFYGKASELGMDAQSINGLAASSPQAVLQLFGVSGKQEQKVNLPSPAKEGIKTEGYQSKQDSFVGRNTKTLSFGATTQDYVQEAEASRKMVEELHEQGLSVSDLANPKKYFATFK